MCYLLSLGFLCQIIETLIFAYLTSVSLAASQGLSQGWRTWVFSRRYPLCQPIPCADSQSSALSLMVQRMLRECNSVPRGCVSRMALTAVSPPYAALLEGLWSCLPGDHTDLHSYSVSHSMNFIFRSHKNCPSLQAPGLAAEFTIAVWLKAEQEGVMWVAQTVLWVFSWSRTLRDWIWKSLQSEVSSRNQGSNKLGDAGAIQLKTNCYIRFSSSDLAIWVFFFWNVFLLLWMELTMKKIMLK